jgi:hypothetical protein
MKRDANRTGNIAPIAGKGASLNIASLHTPERQMHRTEGDVRLTGNSP